jgi:hypothetical protein
MLGVLQWFNLFLSGNFTEVLKWLPEAKPRTVKLIVVDIEN